MASNLSTESVRSLERHLDEVSLAAELELAMVWPRNFEGASFMDLVVLLLWRTKVLFRTFFP